MTDLRKRIEELIKEWDDPDDTDRYSPSDFVAILQSLLEPEGEPVCSKCGGDGYIFHYSDASKAYYVQCECQEG